MSDGLALLGEILARSGVAYAVIGAHAVNAWLEPRFTADIDVTAAANAAEMERVTRAFADAGYEVVQRYGVNAPSGPDFVRFAAPGNPLVVEIQAAKTGFQQEVIRRAATSNGGPRVATPEDLLVLKLIADRPKDQVDLLGLAQLPGLDWCYVEHWADEWEIRERLDRLRAALR